MTPTVLVVDDDRSVRDGLVTALGQAGFTVDACDGIATARAALANQTPDCVMLDIRLRDGDGLDLLAELRRDHPRLGVIMATAYGDSDRTIAAMKLGAFDYITKPFDLDALIAMITRAASASSKSISTAAAAASTQALVGSSARMLDVWKAIGRAAASDVSVLITGESGVGKELVARAIHDNSERAGRPFVAVNIAALPATLVESELFGHERGAFTGAATRREGRFETASDGTIFLDEIGDLEASLQTKLLRVLQDGTFERLGAQAPLTSRARVIAATSKPVSPSQPDATLREDLYYRLGVVAIEVPPLRDRRSDIPVLVQTFLARKAGPLRAVSEDAMQKLVAYSWPGNVRELQNAIERARVMSSAEVLDANDFAIPDTTSATPGDDLLDLREATARLERELIGRALPRAGGNRAHAARLLGIARPQLYAKMRDLDLEDPSRKK